MSKHQEQSFTGFEVAETGLDLWPEMPKIIVVDEVENELYPLVLTPDPQVAFDQMHARSNRLHRLAYALAEIEFELDDCNAAIKRGDDLMTDEVERIAASLGKDDKTLSNDVKRRAEVQRRLAADAAHQGHVARAHGLRHTQRKAEIDKTKLGREWQLAFLVAQRSLVGRAVFAELGMRTTA